jgi:hypothetical protein
MFFTTWDETLLTASHVISSEKNGNQSILNTTDIFAAGENKNASLEPH